MSTVEPTCICLQDGTGKPILSCHELVVGYDSKPILPPIDITLCRSELCAVIGRNGAGKTTWFRTLLGLLPPISGEIITCAPPLRLSYIPQRMKLDAIVPLSAWDVVAMGLERKHSFLRPFLSHAERQRVGLALEEMGAADLAARPFRELSEGQKQRTLIARLLAAHPDLAVLDEPTAAMDEVAEKETLGLIDELHHHHGMAILIVSHHLPVVSQVAEKVIFLDRDTQTIVAGTPATVFAHPSFRARYNHQAPAYEDSHAAI